MIRCRKNRSNSSIGEGLRVLCMCIVLCACVYASENALCNSQEFTECLDAHTEAKNSDVRAQEKRNTFLCRNRRSTFIGKDLEFLIATNPVEAQNFCMATESPDSRLEEAGDSPSPLKEAVLSGKIDQNVMDKSTRAEKKNSTVAISNNEVAHQFVLPFVKTLVLEKIWCNTLMKVLQECSADLLDMIDEISGECGCVPTAMRFIYISSEKMSTLDNASKRSVGDGRQLYVGLSLEKTSLQESSNSDLRGIVEVVYSDEEYETQAGNNYLCTSMRFNYVYQIVFPNVNKIVLKNVIGENVMSGKEVHLFESLEHKSVRELCILEEGNESRISLNSLCNADIFPRLKTIKLFGCAIEERSSEVEDFNNAVETLELHQYPAQSLQFSLIKNFPSLRSMTLSNSPLVKSVEICGIMDKTTNAVSLDTLRIQNCCTLKDFMIYPFEISESAEERKKQPFECAQTLKKKKKIFKKCCSMSSNNQRLLCIDKICIEGCSCISITQKEIKKLFLSTGLVDTFILSTPKIPASSNPLEATENAGVKCAEAGFPDSREASVPCSRASSVRSLAPSSMKPQKSENPQCLAKESSQE
ncbi:uncharacterized protein NEMAJ01_2177 [Nematocida major]|uniref:uncharacterized protein n=1 Tax=Nematocida major TaxID=1912982 RepID=UPI0020081C0A|nr:uncharacterized protein NEMAJ01_2177 [Nematocida major]KAH9387281.1 hypothetical protein NEMAJ01_2177 [Nematocida major]